MLNDLFKNRQPEDIEEDIEMLDPELQQEGDENEDINEQYSFATGDIAPSEQLDAFMAEFAAEKEDKGCPIEPTQEDLEAEDDDPEDEEAISNETARNTAYFIVTTIDETASTGLAYLSKDPQDNFRAGKAQIKNLENLFTKYCKEKGTEISIGFQIVMCLAAVYGGKIPYALDRRSLNLQKADIERERKALAEDRAEMEKLKSTLEEERKQVRTIRDELKRNK